MSGGGEIICDNALALLSLIARFVGGGDQSRRLAEEIEEIVLDCFGSEPWFEDVSVALAQFAPGGGENYFDEGALAAELTVAARALTARWGE